MGKGKRGLLKAREGRGDCDWKGQQRRKWEGELKTKGKQCVRVLTVCPEW